MSNFKPYADETVVWVSNHQNGLMQGTVKESLFNHVTGEFNCYEITLWETGEVWLGTDEYTFTDYKEAKGDYDLNMYYFMTRHIGKDFEEFA